MSVISVTPTATTFSGFTMLVASSIPTPVENLPTNRRFFPFNMVITQAFTNTNNTANLAFTDVANPYATYYPLVDRLNKNITGDQLYMYAGQRNCVRCVYDSLFKVVRVCSCLCPATLTVPSSTPAASQASSGGQIV